MPCGTSGSSVVVEFCAVLKGFKAWPEHFVFSFLSFFLVFMGQLQIHRQHSINLLHRHRLRVHGGIILVGTVRSY